MPIAAVNSTEIYYEVKGSGDPIFLLPGLGRGTSYFDAIEPHLCKIQNWKPAFQSPGRLNCTVTCVNQFNKS